MKAQTVDDQAAFRALSTSDLIAALTDPNILTREQAGAELNRRGEAVAGDLIAALKSSNDTLRHEAACVLRTLRSPAAAPALLEALHDDCFDVRWIAAEALIALGPRAVPLVLRALTSATWGDARLEEGAHHVLRVLAASSGQHDILAPVVAALEGMESSVSVPMAAHRALEALPPQYWVIAAGC